MPSDDDADKLPFILQPIDKVVVVEFRESSLMDPLVLDRTGKRLFSLIDNEDRRNIILDFEKVQYLSSQAIGILLTMHKKIAALGKGRLTLCGVGPKLAELMKITRLDKVLTVKKTQREALAGYE
jgi:anti-sigma B factor antagonist